MDRPGPLPARLLGAAQVEVHSDQAGTIHRFDLRQSEFYAWFMVLENDEGEHNGRRRGRVALSWGTLLGLAWLICEITANPFSGPALAGVKIAWKDFRTALWLRRADPWPKRGRIGFWLYTSWGLTKLFLTAFAFCPLVEVLRNVLARWLPGQGPVFGWDMEMLIGAWLTMFAALAIVPLLSLPAFRTARLLDQRVWINSEVGYSRRRGEWPPRGGTINCFGFLELIILLTLGFAPLCGLVLLLIGTGHHPVMEAVFPFAAFLICVWWVLLIVCCYSESRLQRRVMRALVPDAATSPAEFWSADIREPASSEPALAADCADSRW